MTNALFQFAVEVPSILLYAKHTIIGVVTNNVFTAPGLSGL